jgi:flagellar biosynthesis protein FliQ
MQGFHPAALLADALSLVLHMSAPALIAAVVVGLLVGLISAAMSLQDHVLIWVPRVLLVGVTLVMFSAVLTQPLLAFTARMLAEIANVGQ